MEQMHLVVFRLAQQTFAFSIESVNQIIDMVAIMPLPKADPLIEGAINYHGKMIPTIDMRRLFLNQRHPCGLHTPILLVTIEKQMIGLIVDEVCDVNSVPTGQITKTADFLPNRVPSIPSLRGLTSVAGETVMLLDLNHIFDAGLGQALSQIAEAVRELSSGAADQPWGPIEPGEAVDG